MFEIRTRDEALMAVDRGLSQWLTIGTGLFQQAEAAVTGAKSVADGAVRKWATRCAALELRLSALKENEDPRPLQAELARARQSHQTARQVAAQTTDISSRVAVLRRIHLQRTASLVNEARADLSRRTGELGSYRGSGSNTTPSGAVNATASGGYDGGTLTALGIDLIDVYSTDFGDNPILDNFDKGGTSRADYRWAVQIWEDVVGPGVARGLTRQDFERRDAERGAAPLRQTAAVYDMFLGNTDRILVSRLPGGGLNVTNGRHRLQIARELGVRSLPAEIA